MSDIEDRVIYDSAKTTAYLVLTLVVTLAVLNLLAYYDVIPMFIRVPSDVFIYGIGALTALVLGFLVFDKQYG